MIDKIESIAVLPLRDIVIFPGSIVPLFVGREKSVAALEYASRTSPESKIILVVQKDNIIEDPQIVDIYDVGTESRILQILKLPDGTAKVIFEGIARASLKYSTIDVGGQQIFMAESKVIHDFIAPEHESEVDALAQMVRDDFSSCVKMNKRMPTDVLSNLLQTKDPGRLADSIALHLTLNVESRQEILEAVDVVKRLEMVHSYIESESGVLNTDKRIKNRVKSQMEKTQREYYLNEQLKAIYKELGDGEDGKNEINNFEKKIALLKLSAEAREKAIAEVKKLKSMNPVSSEAIVVRNYLEWLLSVPWGDKQKMDIDLENAQAELDKTHYGMEKVKERVLEYLAVQKRTQSLKSPILCLVGAPGVGKTSLAEAIARATKRPYTKVSLGGVRDEAEIRGHRRTYIGAMPGKIIQGLRKAATQASVFLLDEIDKMGYDFRGDPTAALLEVLDPEQNHRFVDHYLEVDYDLSDVMFVATANSVANITRPLLDRMEVIFVPSYTEDEKIRIANDYLIAKQERFVGLRPEELVISQQVVKHLIRHYTREAGVRNLEKQIAKIARKSLRSILTSPNITNVHVTSANLSKFCGVPSYVYGVKEKHNSVGVSTGLAYTEVGGELLTIESAKIEGDSKIKCTGKLGKVMQESAQAAYSYIRANRAKLGLSSSQVRNAEIHLHVPEGATPKDGPSAGIAICISVLSALTGIPILCSIAMTGEITLRGNVLPIGGLREKLLAALRGGITTVIIPEGNTKDLVELPDNIKRGLKIQSVSSVEEVFLIALEYMPTPITDEDELGMTIPSGAASSVTMPLGDDQPMA